MPVRPELFVPTFLHDLPLASAALEFATAKHQGHWRESDAAPSVLHPLEVASLLHVTGESEVVLAAAVLHDTIEDTDAGAAEIRARFGDGVADIVEALTEDPGIEPFEARKASLRQQVEAFGSDAIAVYAADKVAKVRELRAKASHDPDALADRDGRRRLDHYRQSLEMLEQHRAGHPLVRQLRFELEALAAMPPGAR